jgi:hypothetical protein
MYVNFYDRFQRAEGEAKTIGIVLCSEKNDAMAKITLPEDNAQILARRYQMYCLPKPSSVPSWPVTASGPSVPCRRSRSRRSPPGGNDPDDGQVSCGLVRWPLWANAK